MIRKIKDVSIAVGWIVYTVVMIVGLVYTCGVYDDIKAKFGNGKENKHEV